MSLANISVCEINKAHFIQIEFQCSYFLLYYVHSYKCLMIFKKQEESARERALCQLTECF